MDSKFAQIFASEERQFAVGKEGEVLVARVGALTRLSPTLKDLIHKNREAGCIPLRQVDPDTFLRLTEYGDGHDYTTPGLHTTPPNRLSYSLDYVDPEHAEPWEQRVSLYECNSKEQELYAFGVHHFRTFHPLDENLDFSPERGTRENALNYTALMLCHAKLYVAAHAFGIKHLEHITAQKLYRTLIVWVDWGDSMIGFVELIQYALDNMKECDPVREMILWYIAVQFKDYQHHREIIDLMTNNGELAIASKIYDLGYRFVAAKASRSHWKVAFRRWSSSPPFKISSLPSKIESRSFKISATFKIEDDSDE